MRDPVLQTKVKSGKKKAPVFPFDLPTHVHTRVYEKAHPNTGIHPHTDLSAFECHNSWTVRHEGF